ncbi:helix-turn-helix domain-containing protein [Paracoccus sp. NSM]|uniref:helix-turn-helix domain-containing protein n=1 Tax=Paracoccus sp. NSM TaxID=3457784 RepID=UPI0040366DE6
MFFHAATLDHSLCSSERQIVLLGRSCVPHLYRTGLRGTEPAGPIPWPDRCGNGGRDRRDTGVRLSAKGSPHMSQHRPPRRRQAVVQHPETRLLHRRAGWARGSPDARRATIKAYALQHLRDPGLCVGMIAAAQRIDPSTIHRAFDGEDETLSRWIWTQRLENAQLDISDPAKSRLTLTEIAFSWGFNDMAHFSRAFKARFGQSPRALRQRARVKP